jgi:hypothetical protein
MVGQRQGLHLGDLVGGERDQRAPDRVPREVVRQDGQPGVLGATDAVLSAGGVAVPQLVPRLPTFALPGGCRAGPD